MVIYFLRHAEAMPSAESDYERNLTPKGLEQAEKVGKFCTSLDLIPEIIITSPVLRAKQTAKIVVKQFDGVDLIEERWLACGMLPEICLRELVAYNKMSSVLLVGHEPDISESVAVMIGLSNPNAIKIRKTSLTAIDLSSCKPGAGQLQFSIPVRLM